MNRPPSTRAAALLQWQDFLTRIPRYAQHRNEVTPGHPSVSQLSPALRTRQVLEEELLDSLTKSHDFPVVEKWVQEFLWRTYWKGWLEHRPAVWTRYQFWLEQDLAALPAATHDQMAAITSGRSGVDFMDQLTHELVTNGYLHNHARMWWAAFWIHTRRLPWQAGADFFYRHLLDADPASNTLSWRWVAGLHTPGKAYLVRRSNLQKYVSPSLPAHSPGLEELADSFASPAPIPPDPNPPVSPLPDMAPVARPDKPYAVWLHWDDLCLEHSPLTDFPVPQAIVAVWPENLTRNWSLVKTAHFRTALQDGLSRASTAFSCPTHLLESPNPSSALTSWLQDARISNVAAFHPHTGEWTPTALALTQSPLTTLWLQRDWDRRWFPHATKGFFPFWESIRPHLAATWKDG